MQNHVISFCFGKIRTFETKCESKEKCKLEFYFFQLSFTCFLNLSESHFSKLLDYFGFRLSQVNLLSLRFLAVDMKWPSLQCDCSFMKKMQSLSQSLFKGICNPYKFLSVTSFDAKNKLNFLVIRKCCK